MDIQNDKAYLFWVLFQQAYHAMARVREKELASKGITAHQATLLAVILQLGDIATPSAISKRMFRKSHTVTELINRAVRMNLLKKEPDVKRKNGVRVLLTDKGRQVCEQMTEMEILRRLISVLPPDQLEYSQTFFRLLRDNAMNELVGVKGKWIPPKLTDPSYDA
ncbi:MAG: winged helix-turn-helix transcriptional regulator [Chloroflexi bacterium]|jgi:MarR family transcriptional regulator, organic hydroperoxide resistance regulator|nr:winged helix-turn-helix transcriptional regulator [Chloroflexota bacterium]MBT7081260.1 winged helix-turn-helix transcriptional regulator [Chloroflexota bacterium]MBT7288905.1 winged helix-turn-helix transcriptional regulator [Chloroflexota bacterium]